MAIDGKTQAPFSLSTENQSIDLRLVITPKTGSAEALELSVSQELAKLKLAVNVDRNALRQACESAVRGEKASVIVAKGTPVVKGTNGQLIWSKKISGSEEGRFSHYLGRIEKRVVKKDDPLAKLVSEAQGTDGKDVFGKTIKAAKGMPLKVKAGPNTVEKNGIFYAQKDGVVRLEGTRLVVDEVYIVQGDLTFETGNIDFPGSVIIRGGVLDLFEIKAGGSVQIDGLVEAARITAGGDVEIKGGIEGKKKGAITSRGSVSAKFLVNAEVHADKDVCVETQIISSKVTALGAVRAPAGAIAGGEVTALGGIDAGTIGSDSGVATFVAAGVNPKLAQIVAQADAEIAEGKKKLAAFDKEIESYRGKELTAAIRERLTELQMLKSETAERMDEAEKRRNEAVTFTHDAARPVIIVRNAINPGVTVRVGGVKGILQERLQGPLKAVPDANNGGVRYVATEA